MIWILIWIWYDLTWFDMIWYGMLYSQSISCSSTQSCFSWVSIWHLGGWDMMGPWPETLDTFDTLWASYRPVKDSRLSAQGCPPPKLVTPNVKPVWRNLWLPGRPTPCFSSGCSRQLPREGNTDHWPTVLLVRTPLCPRFERAKRLVKS